MTAPKEYGFGYGPVMSDVSRFRAPSIVRRQIDHSFFLCLGGHLVPHLADHRERGRQAAFIALFCGVDLSGEAT